MIYFLIGLAILNTVNSYVLLQVRKGENQSNIDALIHKVVPAKKLEKIADTARKHFTNYKQYKLESKPSDNELESIVFAIKTDADGYGAKQNGRGKNKRIDNLLADIKQMFIDFMQPKVKDIPNYRAKLVKYNIKPELIQFRNGRGKPSVMYEIETNSILKSLMDVLNSKQFRRYSDNLARTAAYAYDMIKKT